MCERIVQLHGACTQGLQDVKGLLCASRGVSVALAMRTAKP